ncbi:hypothetical protein LCGC14_2956440 [marine sediment metagenome]|uniref:Uncharacterized protein n=1 Tax=marine sediment metagenome TaxID=412755 RepID=A0A0F8ZLB6_9ZZZZ
MLFNAQPELLFWYYPPRPMRYNRTKDHQVLYDIKATVTKLHQALLEITAAATILHQTHFDIFSVITNEHQTKLAIWQPETFTN